MSELYDTDFKTLVEKNNFSKRTFDDAYKRKTDFRDFLPQAIQLFSMLKPAKNYSITDTLANIEPVYFRDHEYSVEDIRNILAFFRLCPPSYYSVGRESQTTAIYNGAVPLFLYAQKFYNNIEYNEWDRNCSERALQTVLGYRLSELVAITADDYKKYAANYDLENFRIRMFTDGRGDLQPYTYYKCNNVNDSDFDRLPKTLRLMLVQGWIFNAQCRSDKMILDWSDWSNIPEAYDIVAINKYSSVKNYSITETLTNNMPY